MDSKWDICVVGLGLIPQGISLTTIPSQYSHHAHIFSHQPLANATQWVCPNIIEKCLCQTPMIFKLITPIKLFMNDLSVFTLWGSGVGAPDGAPW